MDTLDELFTPEGLAAYEWNKKHLAVAAGGSVLALAVCVSLTLANVLATPTQATLTSHPIVIAKADSLTQTKNMLDTVRALNDEVDHELLRSQKSEGVSMMSYQESSEPIGRTDPFAPLVQGKSSNPNSQPTYSSSPSFSGTSSGTFPTFGTSSLLNGSGSFKLPDTSEDMEYTGMIEGDKHNATVALIKISDPIKGSKTLVLKAGEHFTLNGKSAVLRGINANSITLKVGGAIRHKSLRAFEDTLPSSNMGTRLVPAPTQTIEGTNALQGLKE